MFISTQKGIDNQVFLFLRHQIIESSPLADILSAFEFSDRKKEDE